MRVCVCEEIREIVIRRPKVCHRQEASCGEQWQMESASFEVGVVDATAAQAEEVEAGNPQPMSSTTYRVLTLLKWSTVAIDNNNLFKLPLFVFSVCVLLVCLFEIKTADVINL